MLKPKSRTKPSHRPALRGITLKVLLITFLFSFSIDVGMNVANSADNLGLRIDVLPNGTSSKDEPYSQNRRLWLVTSEAKPTSRTIRITSSVDNPQLISLEVAAARRVGESTELDLERDSEIAGWTKFSKQTFTLPPRGQQNIQVTINPPGDLRDYSQDAFLIVKSGATSGPKIDKTRTTAILSSQFQYATPIFYGVGDIENLMSIDIKDVDTYLDEYGKYAEVEILNNGVGPVEINGDIQFTNLDFQTSNIGPLQFSLEPLKPGKTGVGTIRLPDQMVAGKWKIFIQAYVGSYGEAVVITKNLSFDYKRKSQLTNLLLFAASFLALLALLIFKRRLANNSELNSEKTVTVPAGASRVSWIRKSLIRGKSSEPSHNSADIEITQWLDALILESAKPRKLSKTAVRTPSKKPAKKIAKKPVSRSKAPVKKVAAKKKATKKVASKRR